MEQVKINEIFLGWLKLTPLGKNYGNLKGDEKKNATMFIYFGNDVWENAQFFFFKKTLEILEKNKISGEPLTQIKALFNPPSKTSMLTTVKTYPKL
jgi:hypothetical protein